ncbi:MAG TPA: hypothetical protein VK866_11075 [Acidimicrobiales bacterium]|nr:hypothetical protein [Acidimicrobiales bacterium]
MSTEQAEDPGPSLDRQLEEVLAVIVGPAGTQRAGRAVRSAGLPDDLAADVRQEAWLRAVATFGRREQPYPGLDEVRTRVLAHRIIDRVAIDWARGAPRRREVATPHHAAEPTSTALDRYDDAAGVTGPPSGLAALTEVDSSELVRALAAAVGRIAASAELRPSGCDARVVTAAALHVLATLDRGALPGDLTGGLTGGTTWFDRALYAALHHADPERFPAGAPDAAVRQRKLRCGRRVIELLAAACREVGLR